MLCQLQRGETREFVRQNRQLRGQMRMLWWDVERLIEHQKQILKEIVERSKDATVRLEETSTWWRKFQPAYLETAEPSQGGQAGFLREELDARSRNWRRKAVALLNKGMEFAIKNLTPRQVRACVGLAGRYGIEYHVEEIGIEEDFVHPKRLRFAQRNGLSPG